MWFQKLGRENLLKNISICCHVCYYNSAVSLFLHFTLPGDVISSKNRKYNILSTVSMCNGTGKKKFSPYKGFHWYDIWHTLISLHTTLLLCSYYQMWLIISDQKSLLNDWINELQEFVTILRIGIKPQ